MESFDPYNYEYYWIWRDKTPGIPDGGQLGYWLSEATLEELKAAREAALPYAIYTKLQGKFTDSYFEGFINAIDNGISERFPDHE